MKYRCFRLTWFSKKKLLLPIAILIIILLGIFVNQNTMTQLNTENSPDGESSEFLDSQIESFDLGSNNDNDPVTTTFDSSSESSSQSSSQESDGGCENGHGCVSASYNTPINDSQGLELWVQFKDDSWEYSDDIYDLGNIPNNQTIKLIILKNKFGAAGFYVDDTGAFSHGEIVVAPVLENGTQMKTPLAGIFFKLYVKKGETIYNNYITNRALGHDYRDYFEVDDSDGWRLGWHIDTMELQGDTFDVYLGIRMTEDSRRAKIEHKIIPRTRSYDDIGIEYQILGNPQFKDTDFEIDKILAEQDFGYKEIVLDHETDIKTVPDWVEAAKLVTKNDITIHSFDFYDIAEQGLNTTHYKIQNMTLPNGDWSYVVRTLFNKNAPIAQDETLEIDPGLSVSEAANTISVESTGVFNITLQGPAIITWYDLKNDPSKIYDIVTPTAFNNRGQNNGSGWYLTGEYDNPNMTILEQSGTRVIIEVESLFQQDSGSYILMYNGIQIREKEIFTIYSDGRIYIHSYILDEGNPAIAEILWWGYKSSYGYTNFFFGNETALDIENVPVSYVRRFPSNLVGLNTSKSDFYVITNDSRFIDYYDREAPSSDVFCLQIDMNAVTFHTLAGITPVNFTYMLNLGHDPLDDDDSFTKVKNLAGDYKYPASISNEVGGSFDSWNYDYGVYNFTTTESYLNFTFSPDSYPRNYSVFQASNWTKVGVFLYLNETEYTSGTDYLSYYNSTSEILVLWLDSSSLGELRGQTNFSISGYDDAELPNINLNSPANESTVKDDDSIDLNIYDDNVVSLVFYNWDGAANQSLDDPYDLTISTFNGNKTLNVYAVDGANNWNSSVFQFEMDNTEPIIILIGPVNGSSISLYSNINLAVTDTTLMEEEGTEGQAVEFTTSGTTVVNNNTIVHDGTYSLYLRYDGGSGSAKKGVTTAFLWGDFVEIEFWTYAPSSLWTTGEELAVFLSDGESSENPEYVIVYPEIGDLEKDTWVLHRFEKDDFVGWFEDDDIVKEIWFDFSSVFLGNDLGDYLFIDGVDINPNGDNVDTVLYNWDGGSNTTLESPFELLMPYDFASHTLRVYANDTVGHAANSKKYVFIGTAGAGGGGGGGDDGGVEDKTLIVVLDYDVTVVIDQPVEITVTVTGEDKQKLSGASVYARYNEKTFLAEELTEEPGVYKISIIGLELGPNDVEVTVSKTGYNTHDKMITIRGYESEEAIPRWQVPVIGVEQWMRLYGQNLAMAGAFALFLLALYTQRHKLPFELPITRRKIGKPSLPFGIQRRKFGKPAITVRPRIRSTTKALPAARKAYPVVQKELRGKGTPFWLLFAGVSIGLAWWQLGLLFTSFVAMNVVEFYGAVLGLPLILFFAYLFLDLGERGEDEPHMALLASGNSFGAFLMGMIYLIPSSLLLFAILTRIATGVADPFVLAPMYPQAITIGIMGSILKGLAAQIFIQMLVAISENLAFIVIPTLIIDAFGNYFEPFENKYVQMFISSGLFAGFHYYAAMQTLGIQLMFFYFLAGGILFSSTTFGNDFLKIPKGGYVAGVFAHFCINMITIYSANVLFV